MAVDITFLIDGADRGQPTNAKDFGFTIAEEASINARIVSFNNDLIFIGEAYKYIYNNLITTGGCSLIDLEVQYLCSGANKKLTTGYIVVSECTFDLDKYSVSTKLYDDSFSTKINNNKAIPFPLSSNVTKNFAAVTPPTQRKVFLYQPSTGAYAYPCYGVSIYDAFKHLVSCMSDNLVDFDSIYYTKNFGVDGDFDLVTNGLSIINESAQDIIVTFQELYQALNNKIRLGMSFERQANGRPLLRIEEFEYFEQLNPTVNLYDQPFIKLNFDTTQLYAALNFGCTPYFEQHECNGGATACTFFQDSFRGFKDETFGLIGECNTSTILNLLSDKIVFDTNVIEDIYVHNNEDFNNDGVIIQSYWFVAQNAGYARQFDPYNIGQTVYNGDYTNANVAFNWVGGYPNGIYSYIQGFNSGSTQVQATSNTVPLQEWGITDVFTSYYLSTFRPYLEFGNEIIDPSNNWDNFTYIIPYTGTYTFSTTVIINGAYEAYVEFVRSTGQDIFIQNYAQFPPSLTDPITNIVVCQLSWINVCNQGDKINVNVYARVDTDFPPINVTVDDTYDIYTTQFDAIGEPFDSTLQPVDPNEIRRLLYKFERPLTMTEIEAILSNTSRPISFGRYDDPLRVIEGYIKKVDVKSLIEQEASFELKSNKILR